MQQRKPIQYLKADVPTTPQTWRAGLKSDELTIHTDCVVQVPGVPTLVEQGLVHPDDYRGRLLSVMTGNMLYVVGAGIESTIRDLIDYHRDELLLPTPRPERLIPVPSLPKAGMEEDMIAFQDFREATRGAVRDIAGARFFPYCGSEAATAAADKYDLKVMIAAEVARRGNDKAYLVELRKRSPHLAQLIPDTMNLESEAENIMKTYDQEFLRKGRGAVIKPRFGASGMNLRVLKDMDDLESFLREPGTKEVLEDPENGFVLQEKVPEVSVSPSISAWIDEDGTKKIMGFTLQDLKGGVVHVGNKNGANLFQLFPELLVQMEVLLDELHKDGARCPIGFDFVVGKDPNGKPTCKLIEINMRHLGATRGPVRAHDFRVDRENKAPHPWWIGYIQMRPGIGINEVLLTLERTMGSPLFDPHTRTGVMVTMIGPDGRVHMDVHAKTARQRDEWVAAIKEI